MIRLESAQLEPAPDDEPWDMAAEVRRDLDEVFSGAGAAPPAGRVRVAFVERDNAGRRVFGRLTVRDAALAAAAAVLGGVAGASFAPHATPALQTHKPLVREATVARAEPPTPAPEMMAYSAIATPSNPTGPAARPTPDDRRVAALRGAQSTGERARAVVSKRAPRTDATLRGMQPPPSADPVDEPPQAQTARSCADMPSLADERVCESARLATAQEELNAAYDAALAAAERPRALRREQADWLDARDLAARRSDRALEQLYRRRTDELWRQADEARFADDDAYSGQDGRR